MYNTAKIAVLIYQEELIGCPSVGLCGFVVVVKVSID